MSKRLAELERHAAGQWPIGRLLTVTGPLGFDPEVTLRAAGYEQTEIDVVTVEPREWCKEPFVTEGASFELTPSLVAWLACLPDD